ncbi:50S ribosomal protein L28 [candidate division WWE3 bacterium]|jgi:ribosomal protein L28|uniref:50S ribosomal protein L28 n=1 Tax=candidate division WWE3 bacterium TaxID=2053526 RepID=A0A3A4ZFY8_UNCKA|nr:MAG: 50S ribosomal protein L28 [candidate division WWE3 bacterium]
MAKVCDICLKSYQKGNLVPRGIGRRVTRRTTVRRQPNLRYKKFEINGISVRLWLCASCLKRIKFDSKKLSEAAEVAVETAGKTAN